jgi:hypothetical protein
VTFKSGKYKQNRKLNTPQVYGRHFILYGLTQQDLNGNGKPDTILLDNSYNLRVYSPKGRLIVKSNEYYGHDPRFIDVGVLEDVSGTALGAPIRFKGRLEFVKIGNERFLVIPMNQTLGDGLLNRLVIVENSGLAVLRLTREGFNKAFESSKQKGFMAASRVITGKNGKGAEVYTLRNYEEILTKITHSTFSTYEWPTK